MKTYTDDEIVRALDACTNGFCLDDKCPFYKGDDTCDRYELWNAVLDLIKRQQAKIEILKADKIALSNGQMALQKMYLESRAKAVRELAEIIIADYPEMEYYLKDIVKETTEEQTNQT